MQATRGDTAGDWCWHIQHAAPCRVLERLALWGEVAYRVWLPGKDAVLRIDGDKPENNTPHGCRV